MIKSAMLSSPKSSKLRELIRAVRGCKTAAEERAVITKECAVCRTQIKDSGMSRFSFFRDRERVVSRSCVGIM